ncbi:MAG: helix-hairpin-helix domain-containing protein [Gammaproteobacteria bacterium]
MRFISSMLLSAGLILCSFTAVAASPVDINTADASTLAKELNGVGPSRAQAIVAYRNEHGPFKSVDDLALVKNIPRKLIENNRDLLKVDGAKGAPRADAKAPVPRADARAARTDQKAASKP